MTVAVGLEEVDKVLDRVGVGYAHGEEGVGHPARDTDGILLIEGLTG